MPAYEYRCQACGQHFELRQKMSEAPVESCARCGGAVKRLISGGAGVIARGAASVAPACESGPCCMQPMDGRNGCGH
jgi:putative FmdB family regulatory protein